MCDVLKRDDTSLFTQTRFKTMRIGETKWTISCGRGLGYDGIGAILKRRCANRGLLGPMEGGST